MNQRHQDPSQIAAQNGMEEITGVTSQRQGFIFFVSKLKGK